MRPTPPDCNTEPSAPSLLFSALWMAAIILAGLTDVAYAGHHGESAKGSVKLENVVVTADRIAEYIRNHPQHTVVLESSEMVRRNFRGVSEALGSMPGVDVAESGSGIGSRISIRGSGGGSVLILIDGRPMNASQFGAVDLNSVPIDTVRQIMVFKPPVPVWLGPGASAGAVNIVTRGSDPSVRKKKAVSRRLKLSGGSYGKAEAAYTHSQSIENGGFMFSAGAGHQDRKRSNADRDHARLSVHWDRENDQLSRYQANARYYVSDHGVSGPTYNPTPDARQSYHKGSLDFQVKGFAGTAGEYSVKGYGDVERLEDTAQTGFESTLDQYKLGIKGEHTWIDEENGSFRLGGLTEQDRVDHTVSGEHRREKISLHTHLDRQFKKVTAGFGARGDWTSDFGISPAVQGGLSIPLKPFILLKANAGYTENAPSFSQLYQPSHGAIDHVSGNPDLTEEKIFSYDLGVQLEMPNRLTAQVTLFRTDFSDKILYQRNEDQVSVPENIAKAWRQGVEFNVKWTIKKNASLDLSYILQESEEEESGRDLTYTPPHRLKLTHQIVLGTRTRLEATLHAVGKRYSDLENSESGELDEYASVDMKVIHPIKLYGTAIDLFVDIKNLTDTDFESHHGYPDDGLRVVSGVNVNF